MSERTSWEPPKEFDGFRLMGLLGAGAMGRVFRAHDTYLERDVALKFIAAERPEPRAIERFLIEARAIARLQHPNVVSIYRIGDVEGRPYLAYELVRGKTLAEVPRPMPWRDVLVIALGLTRGLAAAHSRGILHRDIKPANIMLSESGEVKLVDFGIAKLIGEEGGAHPTPVAGAVARPGGVGSETETHTPHDSDVTEPPPAGITQVGVVIGTPRYLSPERWAGQVATPRSEVFSLGLVLYELAAGSGSERLHASGERPFATPLPPLRSLVPELPDELAEVIDRAVRLDPEARLRSLEEARDAFEQVSERLAAARPTPAPSGTRYAKNGDISIAYQVFGAGPTDLLFVPSLVSHLEVAWEEPSFAAFLTRLGRQHRVVMFDKRGTGMSDRGAVSSLGERVEDMRLLMEQAGLERPVIFGHAEGSTAAMLFAALYPERTRALVLWAPEARALLAPDYPIGMDPVLYDWSYAEIREKWGGPVFLELVAPARLGDPALRAWWSRFSQMSASPGAAIALVEASSHVDLRRLLPGIRVPTLVLARRGDVTTAPDISRFVAERIPGAHFTLLEGDDHLPFLGDSAAVHAAMDEFLRELAAPIDVPLIATVLVANPVGRRWGELDKATRAAFKRLFVESMTRHGGTELADARNGQLVMTFGTPPAALACAQALVAGAAELGAPGAAVVHFDVLTGGDQRPGKEVIDRIAALAWNAEPGQILATRIVRDLVTQTSLLFEPLPPSASASETLFLVKAAVPRAPRKSEPSVRAPAPKRVRVAVAQGFAKLLAPHLGRLRVEEPDLLVEVLTSNAWVDIEGGAAELALRVGPFTSTGLLITPVGAVGWSLYAAPSYLARHPPPATPTDLSGHDLIGYHASLAKMPGARWIAEHGQGAHIVLECNDGMDIVDAAHAGLGIAALPCLLGGMDPGLVRVTNLVLERRELMLVQVRDHPESAVIARVVGFLRTVLAANARLLLGE